MDPEWTLNGTIKEDLSELELNFEYSFLILIRKSEKKTHYYCTFNVRRTSITNTTVKYTSVLSVFDSA